MSATPASMLQVVSTGLQDRERLNSPLGKPSIGFYKSVMRRRTRWASQWRRVEFDNLADFGRTAVCTLPIQGELITRATLVVELPDIYTSQKNVITSYYDTDTRIVGPSWAWTNGIGHALCSNVQMLINDSIIDQFDSRQLDVIDEQDRPVEHFDSKNTLIARDPSTFSDQQTLQFYTQPAVPQSNPLTIEMTPPFWWNRGPGPQALPIQALWKDKVQLRCTFRPVQECVYTSTRIDPRNPPLSATQGAGPLPNIAGCGFFLQDASGQPIYSAASTPDLVSQGLTDGFLGTVLNSPSTNMPAAYHFTDAYWIIEYVSLEDREAAAYRMADLAITIEQHIPVPVTTTGGAESVRIRLGQSGLVRDLTWVAQRVEAPLYNAYFLYSRDLGPPTGPAPVNPPAYPPDIPWWPNAVIPNWDYGDGYLLPAFDDRRSDTISAAKFVINGDIRFEHEGPSMFRSLIPSLNCRRAPIIDRYIYRYDFGFWPTGGLAEALGLPVDEVRGFANWDKLPRRELVLSMNQECSPSAVWAIDTAQKQSIFNSGQFTLLDPLYSFNTEGLLITLVGAIPSDVGLNGNGKGATVQGVIDWNQLRIKKGYIGLYVRIVENGSASLVLKTTAGYQWISVAAGGGYGQLDFNRGGDAGSAVEIGWQGGNADRTHSTITNTSGTIIYNNIDITNTIEEVKSRVGPNYTMITTGIFRKAQLYFSVEVPNQQFSFFLTVEDDTGDTILYPLTTIIPIIKTNLQLYEAISIDPIQININSKVQLSVESTAYFTTYISTDGDLGCKVFIDSIAGVDVNTILCGGGGGGRLADAGVGQPDGGQMAIPDETGALVTDPAFVENPTLSTGGKTYQYHGGDGFYGGGSGTVEGGGGGSYVSNMITQVNSFENIKSVEASVQITPLKQIPATPPNLNIYCWATRYNRLRISGGSGVLMFNETT